MCSPPAYHSGFPEYVFLSLQKPKAEDLCSYWLKKGSPKFMENLKVLKNFGKKSKLGTRTAACIQ